MGRLRGFRYAAMALVGCGLAFPAHANLLVNASFETGPAPGAALHLSSGSTAVAGWVVMPSSVDYVGTLWTAAEGGRSIGLNGDSPGGISQTFATQVRGRYTVKFWMAGDPETLPNVKTLRVSAAGQSADMSVDITGMWAWDPGWASRVWSFTANSTSSTLTFTSLDTGNAGPSIDSITVALSSATESGLPIASGFTLSSMSPNPMRGLGVVDFGVPRPGPLRLRILDATGREVATLASGNFAAGRFQAVWDGRSGLSRAPAGVYFLELGTPGTRLVKRAVLLR